jgi:hypothetical protein
MLGRDHYAVPFLAGVLHQFLAAVQAEFKPGDTVVLNRKKGAEMTVHICCRVQRSRWVTWNPGRWTDNGRRWLVEGGKRPFGGHGRRDVSMQHRRIPHIATHQMITLGGPAPDALI